MLEHIRRYRELILFVSMWIILGNINTELAMASVVISVILLWRGNRTMELMLGFITLLVFSDSMMVSLEFAKKVKDIYLVLLAVFLIFDKSLVREKNVLFVNFIPFFIWALCMIPRSPIPVVAAQKTISYALIFLVAPFYFTKLIREHGPNFFKGYFWAVTIILVSGLILSFIDADKGYLMGRFRGVFGNPNGVGVFCAMVMLVLVIARSQIAGLFTRIELLWIVGLILISVFISGSRNSLITIVFFFAFLRTYKLSKWLGFAILIFLVVAYEIVISNLPEILNYFGLAKALRVDSLQSGSGRFVAWGFAFRIINSDVMQFFMGKGFAFEEYIFHSYQDYLVRLGHVGGVHNSFLALWINTGIIGLVLWMYGFLKTVFQASRFSYLAMPIVYAIFFSAFFEPWLNASLNPYTIHVILVLSALYHYSREKERMKIAPLANAA